MDFIQVLTYAILMLPIQFNITVIYGILHHNKEIFLDIWRHVKGKSDSNADDGYGFFI